MANLKVSIALPVYNAASKLFDLLYSVQKNTNLNYVRELLVGNDGSDSVTKEVIEHFRKNPQLKIRVIENKVNQGYLLNCNNLFDKASGDIICFLNSDTLVPPGWIERIIQPFNTDPKIALATPFSTNATNLVVLPNEGQSWLDVDAFLQTRLPEYPDAFTAVGFCLAVRKDLISERPLFDESYKLGYYEETDLHYRVISEDLRSIVIDNLLVYHANHSSSFSELGPPQEISDKNRGIFWERWGPLYMVDSIRCEKLKPYDDIRNGAYFLKYRDVEQTLDVLFLLPTIEQASGGISTVLTFCDWLNLHNIKAATLLIRNENVDNEYIYALGKINPWRSSLELEKHVKTIKHVFATHYSTVPLGKELAEKYHAEFDYFIQGPEILYSAGTTFFEVLNGYSHAKKLFCISEFLYNYLTKIGHAQHVYIPLGADIYTFYPKDNLSIQRKRNSIAACLRLEEAKGTAMALYCLFWAKKAGFEIHLFGKDADRFAIAPDFAINHGDLSPRELSNLFSSSEYYLDLSYFEGLGLLPLEAANCGAIPIISCNGGSEPIFKDRINSFYLGNPFVSESFFLSLAKVSTEILEKMRNNARELSKSISLQFARESFLENMQNVLEIREASVSLSRKWEIPGQDLPELECPKQSVFKFLKVIVCRTLLFSLLPWLWIITKGRNLLLRIENYMQEAITIK